MEQTVEQKPVQRIGQEWDGFRDTVRAAERLANTRYEPNIFDGAHVLHSAWRKAQNYHEEGFDGYTPELVQAYADAISWYAKTFKMKIRDGNSDNG